MKVYIIVNFDYQTSWGTGGNIIGVKSVHLTKKEALKEYERLINRKGWNGDYKIISRTIANEN